MHRKQAMFMAKISGLSNRFDESLTYMKEVIKHPSEINSREMRCFAIACDTVINDRRDAIRSVETYEFMASMSDEKDFKDIIQRYKYVIAQEITSICKDVITLIDKYGLPKSRATENIVHYYKIKGDCWKYLAEVQFHTKDLLHKALDSYMKARKFSQDLDNTNPTRLRFILDFSLFIHDTLKLTGDALRIAKTEYSKAMEKIDDVPDELYKDSKIYLRNILDNTKNWECEQSEQGEQCTKTEKNSDNHRHLGRKSRRESDIRRGLAGKMISTADVAPTVAKNSPKFSLKRASAIFIENNIKKGLMNS
mmetsp:Transcript_18698/g.42698  ORF Transcript_18698/g.42698 Transcript_18698/m.42698 type:complete len:308 (-) Transcript_18698:126-1049(-)